MRDTKSCEGLEPRAIAFERNASEIIRESYLTQKVFFMSDVIELPAQYVDAYGSPGVSSGLGMPSMPTSSRPPVDRAMQFVISGQVKKAFANGELLFPLANKGDNEGALKACLDGFVGLTETQVKDQLRLHADCQKYMLHNLRSTGEFGVNGPGYAQTFYAQAYYFLKAEAKNTQKNISQLHYDFFGTALMPIAGIYYWLFGGGATRYVNIGALGLSMVPSDFKPVMDAVAANGPGTYVINEPFQYNSFRFMLNLHAAGLLGRVSGNVTGTLNVGADGSWAFDGSYSLNPDRYDADHSNRTYMQEKLTDFLRFLGDRFGSNDYQIVIEGSQKIKFSGRK